MIELVNTYGTKGFFLLNLSWIGSWLFVGIFLFSSLFIYCLYKEVEVDVKVGVFAILSTVGIFSVIVGTIPNFIVGIELLIRGMM
jgi:hypothetical protein